MTLSTQTQLGFSIQTDKHVVSEEGKFLSRNSIEFIEPNSTYFSEITDLKGRIKADVTDQVLRVFDQNGTDRVVNGYVRLPNDMNIESATEYALLVAARAFNKVMGGENDCYDVKAYEKTFKIDGIDTANDTVKFQVRVELSPNS